jgi:hypothetical protein
MTVCAKGNNYHYSAAVADDIRQTEQISLAEPMAEVLEAAAHHLSHQFADPMS